MASYRRRKKRKFNKLKFFKNLMFMVILVSTVFISGKYVIETTYTTLASIGNIDVTDSLLILVNKEYDLPKDYIPENLIKTEIQFAPGTALEQKKLQENAAKALETLFKEAEKEDVIFYGVSGYRPFSYQKQIYDRKVKAVGKQQADKYVAYPGQSEHQTGLAMDVTNEAGISNLLITSFGKTKEGKWLKDNAYKFGFIIRYPEGKEDITGYNYEPWHLRYIGTKASEEITKQGIVLEEYLQK